MLTHLKLTKTEMKIFIIVLLVSFAAKGASLFPLAYSIDDYGFGQMDLNDLHASYESSISKGRFKNVFINEFLFRIGAMQPHSNVMMAILSMIAIVMMGILICRLWKINEDPIICSIAVSFIAIHPFMAEYFTFKIAIFSFTFLFINFYLVYTVDKFKMPRFILNAIVLGFLFHQLALNIIIISLLFIFIFDTFRHPERSPAIYRHLKSDNILPRIAVLSVGMILYIIFVKISLVISKVEPDRYAYLQKSEILIRSKQVLATMNNIFFKDGGVIMPIFTKYLLLVIMAIALFYTIIHFSRRRNKLKTLNLVLIFVMLLFASISIIGVLVITKQWWPVPRVLYAEGAFWAGITTMAYMASGKTMKKIVLITAGIILFSFIGINNRIFKDQMRLNLIDLHRANRIIERLELHPAFHESLHIAIIGGNWGGRWNYPVPIESAIGDMNISAFMASWSKVPILKEVGGYNFQEPTADQENLARQYCEKAPKFPHGDSVTIKDNLGIICMP